MQDVDTSVLKSVVSGWGWGARRCWSGVWGCGGGCVGGRELDMKVGSVVWELLWG